jgi:hypothetical protein
MSVVSGHQLAEAMDKRPPTHGAGSETVTSRTGGPAHEHGTPLAWRTGANTSISRHTAWAPHAGDLTTPAAHSAVTSGSLWMEGLGGR